MPQTGMVCGIVARPAGFEPTAYRLGGGRSILLSYGRMLLHLYRCSRSIITRFFQLGNAEEATFPPHTAPAQYTALYQPRLAST